MSIYPFTPDHIPGAAALLAQQAKRLREQFPLLPARIQEPENCAAFLQAWLGQPNSQGVVLMEGSELHGYLLGVYRENVFFGRHVWSPLGGMAIRRPAVEATFHRLYAAAGEHWVRDQALNHYLVCPALPNWLQAAFALSFGQEQAHAITSVQQERIEPALPPGFALRPVQPTDAGQLAEKAHWISEHLNRAPVWEPVPEEHLAEIRPGYAELATDPTATTWVALDGERIVSYVVIYTVDIGPEHWLGDEKLAHFAAAATDPEYRRLGVGRALFTRILNVARQQAYQTVETDWRTTNLTAAAYWPTYGFTPFAYRLIRRVNPRYAPWNGG